MIIYESFILGEDVNNLDMCYIENDKLYKIKELQDLNGNLVIVSKMATIEEYQSYGKEIFKHTLKKDSLVRGFRITLIPKSDIIR